MIDKGVILLGEIEGVGLSADKGSRVKFCTRLFLRKGDEVTPNSEMIASYREHLEIKEIESVELVVHTIKLGKRRVIAGIEKGILGMKRNGYREIQVAPHLAYREKGMPDRVPENSILRIKLWVQDVQNAT